jgi:pyridinium-3,5-biscarboxylic acid mononucleotide synthase
VSDLELDHERYVRTGVAEAVYAPGKTPEQCARAVAGLLAGTSSGPVLLTRANPAQSEAAVAANPGATIVPVGEKLALLAWRALTPPFGTDDRTPSVGADDRVRGVGADDRVRGVGADDRVPGAGSEAVSRAERGRAPGNVLLLTAGTADLPVAREAEAVLIAYGHETTLVADVGVAGLDRILARRELLAAARVVIVVAGMEGALASVAAGLTAAPVIAVPTSTGYGSGLEGVTALLAMTASCSPGITVVGIDNGFGAACSAIRMLHLSRD